MSTTPPPTGAADFVGIPRLMQHRLMYLTACALGGLAGGLDARLSGAAVLGAFAAVLGARLVLTGAVGRRMGGRAALLAVGTTALVAGGLVLGPLRHLDPQTDALTSFLVASTDGALLALVVTAVVGLGSMDMDGATWDHYALGGLAALLGAAVVANLLTPDPEEFAFPAGAIIIALYAFPGALLGGVLSWSIRYAADRLIDQSH